MGTAIFTASLHSWPIFFLARFTKAFVQSLICKLFSIFALAMVTLRTSTKKSFFTYLCQPSQRILALCPPYQLSVTSIGSLKKRNFSSFFNKSLWKGPSTAASSVEQEKEFNKELDQGVEN